MPAITRTSGAGPRCRWMLGAARAGELHRAVTVRQDRCTAVTTARQTGKRAELSVAAHLLIGRVGFVSAIRLPHLAICPGTLKFASTCVVTTMLRARVAAAF